LISFLDGLEVDETDTQSEVALCRIKYRLATEEPVSQSLISQIHESYGEWKSETLAIIQLIADERNLIQLNLMVLERLAELTPLHS
jgi:hypothetical protein